MSLRRGQDGLRQLRHRRRRAVPDRSEIGVEPLDWAGGREWGSPPPTVVSPTIVRPGRLYVYGGQP